MVKFICIVLAVAILLASPQLALARPDEPLPYWPKWATQRCLTTIYKIVQHETGNMKNDEVFSFVAEQVIHDIHRMGCNNLTQWRWAIGNYPESRVTTQVRIAVLTTIADPDFEYPVCQFIGHRGDVEVWESYGYRIKVNISFTVNHMTVIGANCG